MRLEKLVFHDSILRWTFIRWNLLPYNLISLTILCLCNFKGDLYSYRRNYITEYRKWSQIKGKCKVNKWRLEIFLWKLSIDIIHYEMNQKTYLNVTQKERNRIKNNFLYMETAKTDNIVIIYLSLNLFHIEDKSLSEIYTLWIS